MNVNNEYYRQGPDENLSLACGAFCLKFWQWHKGAEAYPGNDAGAKAAIEAAYDAIKLGVNAAGLNTQYSNPAKIMQQAGAASKFYVETGSPINALLTALVADTAIQAVDTPERLKRGEKIQEALPSEGYAILIVKNPGGDLSLHYILVYRKADGGYLLHDPAWNSARVLTAFPTMGGNISTAVGDGTVQSAYTFTGAAILLP